MCSWKIATVLELVAGIMAYAAAQGTNVTCLREFEWMNNSRSQSPCVIAAYLISECLANPADAFVSSLPQGYHYIPSTVETSMPCQCSTGFYSVISACAKCQDRPFLEWSSWKLDANCSSVFTEVLPRRIPCSTSIPAWAFLDVITLDAFDPPAAEAFAALDAPEYSANVCATSSATSPATSSVTPSATSTSASEAAVGSVTSGDPLSTQSSCTESDAGPIVGGVIGGIGVIAIIAGIVAFLLLQRRRRLRPAPLIPGYAPHPCMPYYINLKSYDPVTQYTAPVLASAPSSPVIANTPTLSIFALYNPNDPSTFPPTPPGSSRGYRPGRYRPNAPFSQSATRKYNGVAEI